MMCVKSSLILQAGCLLCLSAPARTGAQQVVSPRRRDFWIAGSLTVAATLPLDARIREFMATHQSVTIDRVARPIGERGSPRDILPVLVAGAVIPRLLGDPATSNNAIDIGLGYAVATGTGFILRRAIGRHRPDTSGRSLRFSPLHPGHEWHSFPSGHMLGAVALATGISIKSDRPWVTSVTYGLASMVGLQRLYVGKHWASDVVAGTLLGIAVSATTVRWRERQRSQFP